MIEDTSAAAGAPAAPLGAVERRERLKDSFRQARECARCPQLASARRNVVFGGGDADADVLIVGGAPTAREDELGAPFVGAAGKLLDELLASVGLSRREVFLTNLLKCHPPGNRDPTPAESERCREYLEAQISLVEPRIIVTLGGSATRALRGGLVEGIAELRGRPEIIEVGGRAAHLLPLYHPAAALYTRALLDTLRDDVIRIPELLALPDLPQPAVVGTPPGAGSPSAEPAGEDAPPGS